MSEYTHTANGRTWRLYGCAKRGCDAVNLDFESFGSRNGKGYCLHHISRRLRLRVWWQERHSSQRSNSAPTPGVSTPSEQQQK